MRSKSLRKFDLSHRYLEYSVQCQWQNRNRSKSVHAIVNISRIFGSFIQSNDRINQLNPKGQYLVAQTRILLNWTLDCDLRISLNCIYLWTVMKFGLHRRGSISSVFEICYVRPDISIQNSHFFLSFSLNVMFCTGWSKLWLHK